MNVASAEVTKECIKIMMVSVLAATSSTQLTDVSWLVSVDLVYFYVPFCRVVSLMGHIDASQIPPSRVVSFRPRCRGGTVQPSTCLKRMLLYLWDTCVRRSRCAVERIGGGAACVKRFVWGDGVVKVCRNRWSLKNMLCNVDEKNFEENESMAKRLEVKSFIQVDKQDYSNF